MQHQFRVERKLLKLIGATIHTRDANGGLVARAEQKGFKLKEQIVFYKDEEKQQPLFGIQARSIIDFGATYDITNTAGQRLGSLRRKGVASTFVRDEWEGLNAQEQVIFTVKEDSNILGLLRRWVDFVALIAPQKYVVEMQGQQLATFQHNYNPLTAQMQCTVYDQLPQAIGWEFTYAIPNLLAIIESKQ